MTILRQSSALPGRVRRRRRAALVLILVALLVAGAGLAGGISGYADLRRFEPVALGRAEAELWQAYYERRRLNLVVGIVLSDYHQFGFSPWDSARSGLAAARAAWRFQASRSRPEAMTALPALTHRFAVVARATGAQFDPAEAARLELQWWQLCREEAEPASYAPAIAAATGYVYGLDPRRLADYARLRAAAMHHRDVRGEAMTDTDWHRVVDRLAVSYAALREAIETSVPAASREPAGSRPESLP